MYLPGIYKDNDTETPDYSGCSESIAFNEIEIPLNNEIANSINDYLPDTLENSQFIIFSILMQKQASKIDGYSNYISECYNLDNIDEDLVYKVSSLYNIEYPLDYDVDQLKFLLKNYERIRRERGIEKSIKMLFRVLERTEQDLYTDDSNEYTTVTKINDGFYKIHNSRIQNLEFAEYMSKKVTRAGLGFVIDNDNSHTYSVFAITNISSNVEYDSFDDDKDVHDDVPETGELPLMTDKPGYFSISYDY